MAIKRVTTVFDVDTTALDKAKKDFDGVRKSEKKATQEARNFRGIIAELNTKQAVLKIRQEFAKTPKELKKINKELAGVEKKIEKASTTGRKSFLNLNSTITGLGAAIGGAFAVDRVLRFGAEAFKLAGQAEGVRMAFKRLGDPRLLSGLRRATQGTVSDLELMKNAVQAKNLGVPVQQLGTFFEFARRRAKETGKSVEFLTQSIVTGIGRKSPLILDNLGISATALRDKFKETGDFGQAAGEIIREELSKMGPDIESTSEKTARLAAEWENVKLEIGGALVNALDFFTRGGEERDRAIDAYQILNEAVEDIGVNLDGLTKNITNNTSSQNSLNQSIKVANEQGEEFAKIYAGLKDRVSPALGFVSGDMSKLIEVGLSGLPRLTELGRELAKTLEDLAKGQEAPAERTIGFIDEQIKKQKELIKGQSERAEIIPIQEKIVELEDERARLLGEETSLDKQRKKDLAEQKRLFKELGIEVDNNNERFTVGKTKFEDIEIPAREAGDAIDAALNIDKPTLFEYIDGAIELLGGIDEVARQAIGSIDEIFANTSEKRLQQLEQDKEQTLSILDATQKEQLDKLEQGSRQRKRLEEQFTAERTLLEEKFAQEELRIRQQAARREKTLAIFDATITSAQNVVKALGQPPFPGTNVIAAALAGSLGLAQIAAIASRPIPQFASGTDDAPGGLSWVGERGKELQFVPEHAKILPNNKVNKYSEAIDAMYKNDFDNYVMSRYVPDMIKSLPKDDLPDRLMKSMMINNHFNDNGLINQLEKNRQGTVIANPGALKDAIKEALREEEFISNNSWR